MPRRKPPAAPPNDLTELSRLSPPEVAESPVVDLLLFKGDHRERHLAATIDHFMGKRSRKALFQAFAWLNLNDLLSEDERERAEV
jgi:hypothetical protein